MADEINGKQHCEAHAVEIKALKESDRKQWEVIEKIRDRLPNWATLLIAILSSAIVGLIVKLAG